MRSAAAAGPAITPVQSDLFAGLSRLFDARLERAVDASGAPNAPIHDTAYAAPEPMDLSHLGESFGWDEAAVQGAEELSAGLAAYFAGAALVESDSEDEDEDYAPEPKQTESNVDDEVRFERTPCVFVVY